MVTQDDFDNFLLLLTDSNSEHSGFLEKMVMTATQERDLKNTIEQTNMKLRSEHTSAVQQYSREMLTYEKQLMQYEISEITRKKQLATAKHNLRSLHLRVSFLRDVRQTYEREKERCSNEFNEEIKRESQIEQGTTSSERIRSKQKLQRQWSVNRTIQLKNDLNSAFVQRKRASELPLEATSFLSQLEAERQRSHAVSKISENIASIREQLIKEGLKIKDLHDEEISTMEETVVGLREQVFLSEERKYLNWFPKALFERQIAARELLNQTKVCELQRELDKSAESADESHCECKAQHVTVLSSQRAYTEATNQFRNAVQTWDVMRKWQHRLGKRGTTPCLCDNSSDVSDSVIFRYQGEIWQLKHLIQEILSALKNEISDRDEIIISLEARSDMLQSQIQRLEARQASDIRNLREMVEQSVSILNERMGSLKIELETKEHQYKEKETELSIKLSKTKISLTEKVVNLQDKLQASEEISKAKSIDLKRFRTNKEFMCQKIEQMNEKVKGCILMKDILYRGKLRSDRLEFMLELMRNQRKWYLSLIKEKENLLQQQKNSQRKAVVAMQQKLKTQTLAVLSLGLDVDALFLFFVQRLANLAGARNEYNERLRANGAIKIFAAFCEGPRQDLRVLALEVLARMCWDGSADKRSLGWDILQYWKTWSGNVELDERQNASDGERWPESEPIEVCGKSIRRLIRKRRQEAIRRRKAEEGPNVQNQVELGSEKTVAAMMLHSCMSDESAFVKEALFALCAASFDKKTANTLGLVDGFIFKVLDLCRSVDSSIKTQATLLLANLALGHKRNQNFILAQQGIQMLLELCHDKQSSVVEGASACLANLTCGNPESCRLFVKNSGVHLLIHLMTGAQTINLMNEDSSNEIQANAAECLSSITHYLDDYLSVGLDSEVKHLVLLSGSKNANVQENVGLILGNLARDTRFRHMIGSDGGVEALFMLCESSDSTVQTSALWAICNLAWEPLNQERIGKYFGVLLSISKSTKGIGCVQEYSIACVANAMYYNEANCSRFVAEKGLLDSFLELCRDNHFHSVQQSVLRILISLSFEDEQGRRLGQCKQVLNVVKKFASGPPHLQKLSAIILLNISAHNEVRSIIAKYGFPDLLTQMQHSNSCKEVALLVLDQLADMGIVPDMEKIRKDIGLKGMLHLCKSGEIEVQKLALEYVADAMCESERKQIEFLSLGGVDCMVDICLQSQDDILIIALSIVKSITHSRLEAKDGFRRRHGIRLMLKLIRDNSARADKAQVLEAVLAALINLVIDHERNCRQVLKEGIDVLIGVAQDKLQGRIRNNSSIEDNAGLARTILQIIGPYSFVLCSNCGHKQSSGFSCESCGHKIDVTNGGDIESKDNVAMNQKCRYYGNVYPEKFEDTSPHQVSTLANISNKK